MFEFTKNVQLVAGGNEFFLFAYDSGEYGPCGTTIAFAQHNAHMAIYFRCIFNASSPFQHSHFHANSPLHAGVIEIEMHKLLLPALFPASSSKQKQVQRI